MTASTMPASTESATGPDRDRSQRDPVGGSVRGPGAGTARIDRDWHLLEALRLRDSAAAERLVAASGDRADRLAIRITGNEQDAEAAVPDAVWSVVRKI